VQVARKQGRQVFAFTRPGDAAAQSFALRLGAAWPEAPAKIRPSLSTRRSSMRLSGIGACRARVGTQGRYCRLRGIHMSDIPSFPLSFALAGAPDRLGRQSHAAGWRDVSRLCRRSWDRDADQDLSARSGEQRLGRFAGRQLEGAAGCCFRSWLKRPERSAQDRGQSIPGDCFEWSRASTRRQSIGSGCLFGLCRHDFGCRVRGIPLAFGDPLNEPIDRSFGHRPVKWASLRLAISFHRDAFYRRQMHGIDNDALAGRKRDCSQSRRR